MKQYYYGNYNRLALNYHGKRFLTFAVVANLNAMVIYCHSMVLTPFVVIKQHYCGNYNRLTLNYHGKKFYNICRGAKLKCHGNLLPFHGIAIISFYKTTLLQ
jgi:hypothetical protein